MADPTLRTERLLLRGWRDDDLDPYAAMNADPAVMEHFPSTLTREQSRAHVEHVVGHFAEHGFGLWAVEVVDGPTFIGFVGLAVKAADLPPAPCVEVGWRLARTAWGQGYASEAASEALRFGFEDAGLDEIVSFTATSNERSQAVMRRIGLRHDPARDFDHPTIAEGHPLRRHVLYRLGATEWRGRSPGL